MIVQIPDHLNDPLLLENNVNRLLIKFQHFPPDLKAKFRGGTACYIKVFDENKKGEDMEIISYGKVSVNHKDQFNKNQGRKWALACALGMDTRKKTYQGTNSIFTKELRSLIWDTYKNLFKV